MWTKFVLTVLGSHHASKYSEIYVEEDNNEARKVLRKLYPDIPERVRCPCCIKMDRVYEDYYYESLEEATKPERGYKFNISNGKYEESGKSIPLDEYLKNDYILVIRKYDIEQLIRSIQMSGGYFDYFQYEINEAADNVKIYIQQSDGTDSKETSGYHYNYRPEYKPETIEKFKECENTLRRAAAMLQRVDWLASGDDSEELFHQRWNNEKYIKGE